MRHVSTIIVGGGLAGSTLAWQLIWADRTVLLIDDPRPCSASRIAAGLMTPITGKRLVPTWRWSDCWPLAVRFYRRVESETGRTLLTENPMWRLFTAESEQERFETLQAHDFHDSGLTVQELGSRIADLPLSAPWGGFEMAPAGQLDVAAFLQATQERLRRNHAVAEGRIDPERDVTLDRNGLILPRWSVRADRLVFCQGAEAVANGWFSDVRFQPAKGEILTLQIPRWHEKRVIHAGIWLAPSAKGDYCSGSTYDWEQLDSEPTSAGRDSISARLLRVLQVPFSVTNQTAGIRPATLDALPVLGRHKQYPQLAIFNGLGSKGSLWAPYLSERLLRILDDGEQPEPRVQFDRWKSSQPNAV